MFEGFTDGARKAMVHAKKEALRYNHDFIETDHVLLGIIEQAHGVGFQILINTIGDVSGLVKKIVDRFDKMLG